MAESKSSAVTGGFGRTLRRDSWWLEVLPTIIGLGGFGIYATLRAFEGRYFDGTSLHLPYLSPFYSPLIDTGGLWPYSPALLILAFPLGFRMTCYYYRKAYYRAFFFDPPACAVGEPRHKYSGEAKFPFVLQNIHRYFLYFAVIFLCFLWKDAIVSFWWDGRFGIGLGSLVLLINIILLTLYLLSCHSLRHLVGGKLDCFSCTKSTQTRHGLWKKVSSLNERHMLFAWCSLFSVGFADFYIRLVTSGAFTDPKLW